MRHPIVIILTFFVLSCFAKESEIDSNKNKKNESEAREVSSHESFTLTVNSIDYHYKKIPVYEPGTTRLMYFSGEFVARNKAGEHIYLNRLVPAPGCEGSLPAISSFNDAFPPQVSQKTAIRNDLILLCGSDSGNQNTLAIYSPDVGTVTQLNFGRHKAHLEQNAQGVFYSVVFKDSYFSSLRKTIAIPHFWQLRFSNKQIFFTDALDEQASNYYEEQARRLSNKAQDSSASKKEKLEWQIKLIGIYAKLDLEEESCRVASTVLKEYENKNLLINDLGKKFNLNINTCGVEL